MDRFFIQLWYRKSEGLLARLLLFPLWVLSLLFGLFARSRGEAQARSARKVPARVISVGNLTVGGAGKTPVAIHLARRLLESGQRPAVLSRGYGRQQSERSAVVSDGGRVLCGVEQSGDEPQLIARACPGVPVLVGADRARLAIEAVEKFGAKTLVLDDGFQHRRLARDLDIVVLDAANPFGNGSLLPRGPLRESPQALGRASLAWISKVDQAPAAEVEALAAQVQRLTGRPPIRSSYRIRDVADERGESLGPGALAGKKVLLLAGLARPYSFRATLQQAGAQVVGAAIYPDHHAFSASELADARRRAQQAGAEALAVTEKDWVRIAGESAGPLRVVKVELAILSGEEQLAQLL